METEIVEQSRTFRLFGLSTAVEDRPYGEVGCGLMEKLWQQGKETNLRSSGILHWVYSKGDKLFVGVDVKDSDLRSVPDTFERCDFELTRFAVHEHIGPYDELPQKWESLKQHLESQGETITMPSLEIYDHSCDGDGDDESNARTRIVIGLQPVAR